MGGQSGYERRIEVFVKIQKNGGRGVAEGLGRGSGLGVRVDVNEELKFFWENSQKNRGGGVGRGGQVGVGLVGGSGWM